MFGEFLSDAYPWLKALHVASVIAWMAGLFYLPRLFVYHTEEAEYGTGRHEMFCKMEYRLLRIIATPAMLSTWIFGLALVAIPGAVDWSAWWPWIKSAAVIAMSWFHMWLARKRRQLANGECRTTASVFRRMNEIPTILMLAIVVVVVVKPF